MRVWCVVLDSPVILGTAFCCVAVHALAWVSPSLLSCFSWPSWRLCRLNPLLLVQLVTHSLGHADSAHLQQNLMLLSLVGPPCEHAYGSSTLLKVLLCCSVAVAACHWLLGPANGHILGLSGVVFALMMLNGFAGSQRHGIPASALLTGSLWLISELLPLLQGTRDGVSHLSHLAGALVGSYCGYAMSQVRVQQGFRSWLVHFGFLKPRGAPMASFQRRTEQIGRWLRGDQKRPVAQRTAELMHTASTELLHRAHSETTAGARQHAAGVGPPPSSGPSRMEQLTWCEPEGKNSELGLGSKRRTCPGHLLSGLELTDQNTIHVFYSRVWNARDDRALREILSPELRFRGSTEATERVGPEAFKAYRDAIHQALRDYTCTLQDVLVEGDCAFARVWFRGTHVGQLLGLPGTGRAVEWIGCARFRVVSGVHGAQLGDIWVLGDLYSLQQQLGGATIDLAPRAASMERGD
ncbi:Metallophosphoesterase domain-containing protein 1 [Durusdinium trenchii]|uniref:Metallophosphoesterase domain-containing protein 1 n=1 Tax=Durusdinium trenchii TaxID=1381693 RepID=A0ABP0NDH7_9DINO